jgi:hypothetical protein
MIPCRHPQETRRAPDGRSRSGQNPRHRTEQRPARHFPLAAALLALLPLTLAPGALAPQPGWAQSQILESVKRNPAKAKKICAQLRQMNADGVSYTSPRATRQIAQQEGLSPGDAEVLTTYVVGLHCPDVR